MVKFEELLEKFQAGDKTAQKQMNDLFGYLKDREITILREYYGIGCNPRPAEEIGDMFGLEENEVIQILKKTKARIEYIMNAGDNKLADCDDVTDDDFRKLNLDKEITVKEYINNIENDIIKGNRIGKRQSELYLIAKENYPIFLEVSPNVIEELDSIPLNEMIYYVTMHEYRQNYNHINRLAPTFGSLLRWEVTLSNRPKLFEITILKWKRFVLENIQEIISNWKEFVTIVDYPLHYDASRSTEENLKIAYLEIADTLDKRVDNNRYTDKCARWSTVLKMKYGENKSLDAIALDFELTRERVRQILSEITDTLLKGDVFCENIKLNPALISPTTTSVPQSNQVSPSEEQQPISDLSDTDLEEVDNAEDNCQNVIFKVGCNWEYIQDSQEIMYESWEESEEFNDIAYIAITDRVKMQVCVLRKGDKYGIYTLDHTNGFGGPGTWCCPTVKPFPYDEVKYCTFPMDDEYGVFAFRIGSKWGIIKVVDGSNEEEGLYDVEYLLTKRRIVVPCEYGALEDAELQLRESYDWIAPFEKEKDDQTAASPTKRDVKKGTGRDKIRVTFPDGTVIEDSVVWKTMAETIKRLGVSRVEKLKIPGNIKQHILLVDTHLTDNITYKKQQHELESGYYLLTYNNTEQKAIWLERISDELNAHLKIEIIC